MARNVTPKKIADEQLALLLAQGLRVSDAASQVGLAQNTVWRKLRNDEFCDRVEAIREKLFSNAMQKISGMTGKAADKLSELIDGPDAKLQFWASREILNMAIKGREISVLQAEIDELRKMIEAQHDAQFSVPSDPETEEEIPEAESGDGRASGDTAVAG